MKTKQLIQLLAAIACSNTTINDAKKLAKHLGIKFKEVNRYLKLESNPRK